MALFQKKSANQVRYFRALEGRYLALAYLTSHKQQAEFYTAIAHDYGELADEAAAAQQQQEQQTQETTAGLATPAVA